MKKLNFKTISNIILLICFIFIYSICSINNVNAKDSASIINQENKNNYKYILQYNKNNQSEEIDYANDELLPNVSMEDFTNKVTKKLLDIVRFMQKIALPICAIFFILATISAILGIGNKNGFYGSLKAMLFSALSFICIRYAEEIVMFFDRWFKE